jgi:hypothetical protein
MNLIALACLVIACFILTWIGLWAVVTTTSRRVDDQLRYHRQALLKEFQTELKMQEINLASRLSRP